MEAYQIPVYRVLTYFIFNGRLQYKKVRKRPEAVKSTNISIHISSRVR
jgi:hypothetical protein